MKRFFLCIVLNFYMRLMAFYIILGCLSANASVPSVWLERDDENVIWRVMGTEYEDAESAGKVIRRLLALNYDGYFFLFCDSHLSVGQLQKALDFLHQLGVRRILFHRIRGTLVEPGEEVLRYERARLFFESKRNPLEFLDARETEKMLGLESDLSPQKSSIEAYFGDNTTDE